MKFIIVSFLWGWYIHHFMKFSCKWHCGFHIVEYIQMSFAERPRPETFLTSLNRSQDILVLRRFRSLLDDLVHFFFHNPFSGMPLSRWYQPVLTRVYQKPILIKISRPWMLFKCLNSLFIWDWNVQEAFKYMYIIYAILSVLESFSSYSITICLPVLSYDSHLWGRHGRGSCYYSAPVCI